MSAKQAEEQMKEIQSESQRMARQMAIRYEYLFKRGLNYRNFNYFLSTFAFQRSVSQTEATFFEGIP